MVLWRVFAIAAFPIAASAVAAQPCEQIVADTAAEMRAGASGWSADVESLVRAAAGSACIKARSGRYDLTVPTAAAAQPATAGTPDRAIEAAKDTGDARDADRADDKGADDGSFSIGGITFRGQSGSPNKKPYERAREAKEGE